MNPALIQALMQRFGGGMGQQPTAPGGFAGAAGALAGQFGGARPAPAARPTPKQLPMGLGGAARPAPKQLPMGLGGAPIGPGNAPVKQAPAQGLGFGMLPNMGNIFRRG